MSPPRRYHLGKRADSVAETRRQILDGAAAAYLDLGVKGTSMQEVARRADVAPATVLNHFDGPDDLAAAVVDNIIESLALPDSATLDEATGDMDRIRILIDELYDFYERSNRWFVIFARERDVVPAFREGEQRVQELIGQLIVHALGDRSDDGDLTVVVSAAVHPAFCGALGDVSRSMAAAKVRAFELVESWYETRRRAEAERARP